MTGSLKQPKQAQQLDLSTSNSVRAGSDCS